MIDGKCSRCKAEEVYETSTDMSHRGYLKFSLFAVEPLREYVCCECGLMETYLRNMGVMEAIKKKGKKVHSK